MAKFCPECARPTGLALTAATAPRFASPENYTPRYLAERILTSKGIIEGERKRVTVLFADMRGSMELLADRDPEEARKLLDPVLERMMEAVHRYEGTVNQVMGDGIMALFGAPLACEDHAVRACYAALRIQETVKGYAESVRRAEGIPIQIRIGLNSGEVVVRSIQSDLHMDYTAVGQTTHVAARMEQMALPGTILLSAETLALAEGYIEVSSLGPLPVKGLAALIEVYELTRATTVRSRFQATAARGLTRFVGRKSELEQLNQALERAWAGHGQVVAVVGEPGVGKSRLYWEFIHSHRAQSWLVLESSSVSYGKATNYLPILNLLRAYFSIEREDDPRKIREKVTGKLLSLDRQLEPSVSPILWLLDVRIEDESWERLDPPQRRQMILDGVKQLLLRESQVQPIMVLFEDLHWIDAESQALLESLVESLPRARILLLVNYRPEYSHGWGGKTYYRQLQIDPLPPENAEVLLDSLLGSDATLVPLKRLVIDRTDGNPFFIEESIRSLIETGIMLGERGAYRLTRVVQDLQVPATVQAMLAARIDRLDPEDKRLLQAAAVIGTEVPWTLLQAVTDEAEDRLRRRLAHLQTTEFLYETRLFPDLEYSFKHALTHEVAYDGLLQDRRLSLHAQIVRAVESLYPERLAEHVETLAHHALRGELYEKALHYLREAGLKAASRSALPNARVWFDQALGVLERLPENQATLEQGVDIRLELCAVLNLVDELRLAHERLREADALVKRLNDDRRSGHVHAFMTRIHMLFGEFEKALVTGTQALDSARRLGDLELRIFTTNLLGTVHYFRTEFKQAVELATDNLATLPADWIYKFFGAGTMASVSDRCLLIRSLAQLGRFSEAARYEGEAIRLAETTQHAYPVGLAYYSAGIHHLLKGDWAKARSLLEHGLAVFRAGNVAILLRATIATSAWVLAQLGDTNEALNRLQEGNQILKHFAASGHAAYSGWGYQSMGRACLLLGRLEEAGSLGARAVESDPSYTGFAAHALHLLGDVATHPDQFDAESGEAYYYKALALAEAKSMRPLVSHCHSGLGKLYLRMGRKKEAKEHLAKGMILYREMDMRFWQEQTEE
jgi:class 3 adenylate cyclase/tetratricopeptide (TPR) repeat protein